MDDAVDDDDTASSSYCGVVAIDGTVELSPLFRFSVYALSALSITSFGNAAFCGFKFFFRFLSGFWFVFA